jgi:hypothetical protein
MLTQDELPHPSQLACEIAERCWCDPATANVVFDGKLSVAFAKRIQLMLDIINNGYDVVLGDEPHKFCTHADKLNNGELI